MKWLENLNFQHIYFALKGVSQLGCLVQNSSDRSGRRKDVHMSLPTQEGAGCPVELGSGAGSGQGGRATFGLQVQHPTGDDYAWT